MRSGAKVGIIFDVTKKVYLYLRGAGGLDGAKIGIILVNVFLRLLFFIILRVKG